jgi:hypothetical protein
VWGGATGGARSSRWPSPWGRTSGWERAPRRPEGAGDRGEARVGRIHRLREELSLAFTMGSLQRCMFVTFVCVIVFFLRIVTGCMFVVLFRAVFAPVF